MKVGFPSSVCVFTGTFPVFQECVGLIRRVCVGEGADAELANKLTDTLKGILSDNKV